MKRLFDSSAIFKAINENKVEVLAGNLTLDLARYELGNIVWKESVLMAKFSEENAKKLLRIIGRTLSVMDVLGITGWEEHILETASNAKVTFYDGAYVCFAKAKGVQLVTEDLRLIKKANHLVNFLTFDECDSHP